jgi:hypothetical protein
MIRSALLVSLTFAAVSILATPAQAQRPRVSPHDTISSVIDGNRVTVVYGRPYTKDPRSGEARTIWGGVVPHGRVWRMGADEATLLISQMPIEVGGKEVPAGAHTLFLLPAEDGTAKLIINKQIGQWGVQYDEKHDLARIDVKSEALEPAADQFTMSVGGAEGGGGQLKLMWADRQYTIPFTVKK